MLSRFITILMALALLAAAARGAPPKPTAQSVESGLVCQCGCNGILSEPCQHYECAMHAQMRALVQKEIDEGKDEAAIRQDFVSRYGIQVLAAPPAKGFNLTVWILPGLGLLAGLAMAIVLVRRWRSPSAPASAGAAPVDAELLAAVEEEMKTSGLGPRV